MNEMRRRVSLIAADESERRNVLLPENSSPSVPQQGEHMSSCRARK